MVYVVFSRELLGELMVILQDDKPQGEELDCVVAEPPWEGKGRIITSLWLRLLLTMLPFQIHCTIRAAFPTVL
jgi:hypothetical protein